MGFQYRSVRSNLSCPEIYVDRFGRHFHLCAVVTPDRLFLSIANAKEVQGSVLLRRNRETFQLSGTYFSSSLPARLHRKDLQLKLSSILISKLPVIAAVGVRVVYLPEFFDASALPATPKDSWELASGDKLICYERAEL